MATAMAEREEVLRLIVSQLQYYDQSGLARVVAQATGVDYEHDPSDQLAQTIVQATLAEAATAVKVEASPASDTENELSAQSAIKQEDKTEPRQPSTEPLNEDSGSLSNSLKPAFSLGYITSHRSAVNCAAFSHDGQFVVTGSDDCCIRVLDVKVMNKSDAQRGGAAGGSNSGNGENDDAVIKTLIDHTGPIRDLSFHPSNLVVASCSSDRHIRFYDITRNATKRSFRYIQDTYPVRTIDFHPAGSFLIAGTSHHPALRLYDIQTFKCYTSSDVSSGHGTETGGTNCVRVSPDARLYASCGDDGYIKLWDVVNGECIASWKGAHNNEKVYSVQWTQNSQQLLSVGGDATVKLWEVSTSRTLKAYYSPNKRVSAMTACLTHNETYVVSSDASSLVFWDTQTGELVSSMETQHTLPMGVVSSPVLPGLLTYGDEGKMRYWAST